jgi:hypothetical protein
VNRPFFSAQITELEAAYEERRNEPEFLAALDHELSHRNSERAAVLKDRLREHWPGNVTPTTPISGRANGEPELASVMPAVLDDSVGHAVDRQAQAPSIQQTLGQALPAISNAPAEILSAWTALEVLSPQSFRKPEELAAGRDRSLVASLDRGLPWAGVGESSRFQKRLFYQVVIGTIDLEKSVHALLERFADNRVERPKLAGEAVLASAVVDRNGCLVDGSAVSVSSFGWGMPQALAGHIHTLADWAQAGERLAKDLDHRLRRVDQNGDPAPIDSATLGGAFDWLVTECRLPPDFVRRPYFSVRVFTYFRSPDPPGPLLLNSFFLADLTLARSLIGSANPPPNLARYLGMKRPTTRRNLLSEPAALEAAVRPATQPSARWPGSGRHPLVLLQQAAVNLATTELKDGGILAVNGPPGTGKTTLLRDVVAALVTARAEAMVGFDDPASAFIATDQRIKAGQSWLNISKLSPKLRGFEMLIASSNNKAVENVSGELPGIGAIASDAPALRYFKPLSDALLGRETWGLIAAVLGNAANRGAFIRTLWSDKEVGIAGYLAEASGTPQWIEEKDPGTGALLVKRKPRIVTECDPPTSRPQALARWKKARADFLIALAQSRSALADLAKIRETIQNIPRLQRAVTETEQIERNAKRQKQDALAVEAAMRTELEAVRAQCTELQTRSSAHTANMPPLWARLFATATARRWKMVYRSNLREYEAASQEFAGRERQLGVRQQAARDLTKACEQAELRLARLRIELAQAAILVSDARQRLGARLVDETFFGQPHADLHKAVPWCDEATHRLRDTLFEHAMKVHKAFIDAAATPMLHNLNLATRVLGGWSPPDAAKIALLPDLWSTLFLLAPAVSTTFASVERMMKSIPAEGLGWLMIDEAGQALPQAAVGAVMRTRRAIVVGDPIQIEPVVTLPESLTQSICRQFGVDPDLYNAPDASAQTMADSATAYFAEFHGTSGSREVGVPLLVHRRCEAPMFDISNAIAYSNLMVHEKRPSPSPIRECLGSSHWIDVQGDAEEKWCPQEGEAVLSLLRSLKSGGIRPDLYIVTPFVIVADKLRQILRSSKVLDEWVDDPYKWALERIGTVHTVQGREAEAVIFVLGAPGSQQNGARRWAGGRPNLLNVAVSRAKEVIYVVGNRSLWGQAGVFSDLSMRL